MVCVLPNGEPDPNGRETHTRVIITPGSTPSGKPTTPEPCRALWCTPTVPHPTTSGVEPPVVRPTPTPPWIGTRPVGPTPINRVVAAKPLPMTGSDTLPLAVMAGLLVGGGFLLLLRRRRQEEETARRARAA